MTENNSHKKYVSYNTDEYASLGSTTERNAEFMWLALQARYNNNIIKDYSIKSLSLQLGLSQNSFKRYLSILKKASKVNINGSDLVVIPQEKEDNKHYTVFHFYRSSKLKDIKRLIVLDRLKRKNEKQQYNIILKDVRQEFPHTNFLEQKEQYKLVKKSIKEKINTTGKVNYKTFTSLRGIAKDLGISIKQAQISINDLVSTGLIKTNLSLNLLKKNSSMEELKNILKEFNQESKGGYTQLYLAKNNRLYIVEGTHIGIKSDFIIIEKPKQTHLNNIYNNLLKQR